MLAIVAHGLWILSWVVAGLLEDRYSPARNYVSELSARGADHPWIVNPGVVALGASFLLIAAAVQRAFSPGVLGPGLIALTGLVGVVSPAFPLDCPPSVDPACEARQTAGDVSWRHWGHLWLTLIAQTALALSPFALALRPGRFGTRAVRAVLVIVGVLGLLAAANFIWLDVVDEPHQGIYQRLLLGLGGQWILVLAAAVFFLPRATPGPRPPSSAGAPG